MTSEVSSIAGFKALIQNMNAAAIGATDDAISLLYSGKLTNTESAWQVLDPLTKSTKVGDLKTMVYLGADTDVVVTRVWLLGSEQIKLLRQI